MDDHAFDAVAKQIGAANRRSVLRGLVGLGALALAGGSVWGDADAARRGFSGPGGSKRDDCPAYCEDDDLLIIQAEIGGICAPYLRFWCGGDLVCVDGVCRSPI
jgi:hypothetical protein